MNKDLINLLDSIIAGNDDQARVSFHTYLSAKTKKLVEVNLGQEPAVSDEYPTRGAKKGYGGDDNDEFGYIGKAFVYNDSYQLIQHLSASKAKQLLQRLSTMVEVKPTTYDSMLDYFDNMMSTAKNDPRNLPGDADPTSSMTDERNMQGFLMNLEGYDVSIYEVDHGDAGFAHDAHFIIIVNG